MKNVRKYLHTGAVGAAMLAISAGGLSGAASALSATTFGPNSPVRINTNNNRGPWFADANWWNGKNRKFSSFDKDNFHNNRNKCVRRDNDDRFGNRFSNGGFGSARSQFVRSPVVFRPEVRSQFVRNPVVINPVVRNPFFRNTTTLTNNNNVTVTNNNTQTAVTGSATVLGGSSRHGGSGSGTAISGDASNFNETRTNVSIDNSL